MPRSAFSTRCYPAQERLVFKRKRLRRKARHVRNFERNCARGNSTTKRLKSNWRRRTRIWKYSPRRVWKNLPRKFKACFKTWAVKEKEHASLEYGRQ